MAKVSSAWYWQTERLEDESRYSRTLQAYRMFHHVDPKSVQVNLTVGSGVVIEWQDGHRSEYSFRFLRDACPCANCVALRAIEDRRPGEPKQLKQGELLPILRPVPKLERAEPVRNYAIRLHWDDGHAEGNYSWEFLRDICPCTKCKSEDQHQQTFSPPLPESQR